MRFKHLASRPLPDSSTLATRRPATSWRILNGRPRATRSSATSVAQEPPSSAAAAQSVLVESESRDHGGHARRRIRSPVRRPERRAPCPLAGPWHRRAAAPSAASAGTTSSPMGAAARPRTSSAMSGLRFWGIIDEPVDHSSGSRAKPTSATSTCTISSASPAEMDSERRASRKRGRRRSPDPRPRPWRCRTAVEQSQLARRRDRWFETQASFPPARRPPERQRRPRACRHAVASVARQREAVSQKVKAHRHRLSGLEVRETGHQGLGMLLGALGDGVEKSCRGLTIDSSAASRHHSLRSCATRSFRLRPAWIARAELAEPLGQTLARPRE